MTHATDSAAKTSFGQAVTALQNGQVERAVDICQHYLVTAPGSLPHLHLLAHGLAKLQRYDAAESVLRQGLTLAPDMAALHDELGSLLAQTDRLAEAVDAFERALSLAPNARTQKKLATTLQLLGRETEAEAAFADYLAQDPEAASVTAGAEHWRAGRYQEAERVLTNCLHKNPNDVNALHFLAQTYQAQNKQRLDAEALLRKAVQLAPEFTQAWQTLGSLLIEKHAWQAAIEVFERLTQLTPNDALVWANLGHAYTRNGDIQRGLAGYNAALARNPKAAGVHMSRAHLLKTLGQQADALSAYRQAIVLNPSLGEAYWSMANLKVVRFTEADIAAMNSQLEAGALSDSARVHLHFALGKAYEDDQNYERAWHHYQHGNQLQRAQVHYDPVEHELLCTQMKTLFTPAFVARHTGVGNQSTAPIFIVGLPRSGSTLIEQILASHSQVEGTEELHHISSLAHATGKYRSDGATYPDTLARLGARDFAAFAQQYLRETQQYRSLNRPYFIDKMPNNFVHIGWIKLLFPNAKIINTRRFPLDSLLGAYKQLFAKGQNFTYDLLELSEYYQSYVGLMEHWHRVFPGQILDVHYEHHMVDFDQQVRRILDYCGLPFEENCLTFYRTERAVKTASSEQVRQPIYTSALGVWKHYAPQLTLWQEDLAEVIQRLPAPVKQLAG